MLNITHDKSPDNYEIFYIETKEGKFQISFANNLDLYWGFHPEESLLKCNNTKEFTITQEDYFIYNLFNELYEAIKNKTPYSNSPFDSSNKYDKYDNDFYNPEKLFKNNCIEWHSDDFEYDKASVLTIKKNDDETFSIIFQKSKDDEFLFNTFFIRFRNSGSSYKPYNFTFMSMYNKLHQYNFDCHQIHMEEYVHRLGIKKQKEI